MTTHESSRMLVRLTYGWIALFREEENRWALAWMPDHGRRRTFSGTDTNLPPDYPASDDPEQLLAWARRQFGRRP